MKEQNGGRDKGERCLHVRFGIAEDWHQDIEHVLPVGSCVSDTQSRGKNASING